MRQRVEANRPWARTMGYARAVRVGNVVEVAGTAAAAPDGTILAPGDVEGQARWEEAARVHGEVFRDVRPANTAMGGMTFIDPAILVEVEVSAVIEPG